MRYIVFHEMLHAVVPRETANGRLNHHTRQFRTLETAYPNLGAMQDLCRELLDEELPPAEPAVCVRKWDGSTAPLLLIGLAGATTWPWASSTAA